MKVPAFRIARGDVVNHERRRCTVLATQLVVFYPRNRANPVRHGVELTLRPLAGGRSIKVTFDNYDLVTRKAA